MIRVNRFFLLGLGRRLYSPTFLALVLCLGLGFLVVLVLVVNFMSYIKFIPLPTLRNWHFAVYGLSFLSVSPSYQTVKKSPDLLAGFDLF